MDDQIEALRRSTGTLLRILKIMEPEIPSAHDRFKTHPSDIAALKFIADNPGTPAVALAAHLGVAPTTTSSILDRLVRHGLVTRERPETNRRSVALLLSQEGTTTLAQIIEEERETNRRMLMALPPSNRAPFVAAMETIAARLSEDTNIE